MGKTSKWIRNFFLPGKKEKSEREIKPNSLLTENPTTPISVLPTTPKEKRRWSFRRSSAGTPPPVHPSAESENEQKRHAMAMAAATAAAADAAVAAAQAAAAVIRLTAAATGRSSAIEEAAAMKIQSVFRGYLARKALNALKGLVKLQALVRGHLVRKQAATTLRCMQALVTVQARARMQRIKLTEDSFKQPTNIIDYNNNNNQRPLNHRKSTQENRLRPTYHEMDRGMEENIKIVEMDYGDAKTTTKGRNSYSNYPQTERTEHQYSTHSAPNRPYSKHDQRDVSPAPSAMSALTELSPRACSNHFEEYSFNTAQSSPQYYSAISKPREYSEFGPASFSYQDYPFFPNYMANTESSRAKARSQSAPKSRPDSISPFERQLSKRRPSIEGRNVPRAVRMQRSSSHVGSTAQNYQHPWSVKLDRSTVSLKDSECGSTSTVLTNTNYCRSLVGFEVSGNRY